MWSPICSLSHLHSTSLFITHTHRSTHTHTHSSLFSISTSIFPAIPLPLSLSWCNLLWFSYPILGHAFVNVCVCVCECTGLCKMSRAAGTNCPHSSSRRRIHPSRRRGGGAVSALGAALSPIFPTSPNVKGMIHLSGGELWITRIHHFVRSSKSNGVGRTV